MVWQNYRVLQPFSLFTHQAIITDIELRIEPNHYLRRKISETRMILVFFQQFL